MADDNIFDKKKIIEKLRAQGIPDKEIEKLYGKLPPPPKPQAKPTKDNAWKYDNKHKRPVRMEDSNPDYEPIEELREKTKKRIRISKKKPKPKVKRPKIDWNTTSENRLKALYEAGYSNEEMANEFKTTKDAITGKLSRLRAAGWKGTIGTTHNPIPSPAASPQATNRKLSPGMKRFLASALERNFGAVGRFFSRKWGLVEDRKFGRGGGGSSGGGEVTAAVIKANQEVIGALTKLDTTLKRGTNTLTKSVANATSKMTDAITNAVELVKKNTATENGGGSSGGPTGRSGGGGTGSVGLIAALLGGAGLAMLLSSHGEASINPNDHVDSDEINTPQDSENNLRKEGAPKPLEQTPEVDIKVKELTFEADDITFEADEFKFQKRGHSASGGEADAAPAKKPSAGFFNDLADKLIGGRGGGGYAGGGGKDGQGGGPLPSEDDLDKKDKSWFGGRKSGASGGPSGAAGSSGGTASGSEAKRIQEAMAAAKDQLRAEGVPEANIDAAASHLVGQALSESGLNPNASHDNGTGYGIYGARLERRESMLKWLKENNHSRDSLTGQMKYMAHEAMTNPRFKPSRDALMGATKDNNADTARTLTHNFEAPRYENWQDRMGNARKALNTHQAQQNATASLNPEALDPDKHPAIRITPDVWKQGSGPVDPTGRSYTGKYNRDFSLKQGNPDPNEFKDDWRDSIQPQDLKPNSGTQLNGAQKEQDDRENTPNSNERFDSSYPDKRSDNGDGQHDSFQTTILETRGPSHFMDYEGLKGGSGDGWQTMDG